MKITNIFIHSYPKFTEFLHTPLSASLNNGSFKRYLPSIIPENLLLKEPLNGAPCYTTMLELMTPTPFYTDIQKNSLIVTENHCNKV